MMNTIHLENIARTARGPLSELYDQLYQRAFRISLQQQAEGLGAPINSASDIGLIIRTRRKAMNISQATLADKARVGRRFVGELEAGKPTVQLDEALRVCRAAGIGLVMRITDGLQSSAKGASATGRDDRTAAQSAP